MSQKDFRDVHSTFHLPDILLGGVVLDVAPARPTAAATAWNHLAWWAKHLGPPLHLMSALVADFRFVKEPQYSGSSSD